MSLVTQVVSERRSYLYGANINFPSLLNNFAKFLNVFFSLIHIVVITSLVNIEQYKQENVDDFEKVSYFNNKIWGRDYY